MGTLQEFWTSLNCSVKREKVKTLLEVVKTFGLVFTGVGLILTYCDAQEDRRLTQERLVTDRFSKAIEQLGEEQSETVHIGGIFSLKRIAEEYPKDYWWTIIEILAFYVRHNSPSPEKEQEAKSIDINVQTALTVIGRRDVSLENIKKLEEGKSINLTNTNLTGANLTGANLTEANLAGANLTGANLTEANLAGANLTEANLAGAVLPEANLTGANLAEAVLPGAKLIKANLTGANLTEAVLPGANLLKTNLTGADLTGANFSTTDSHKANFAGADLKDAVLFYTNLKQTKNLLIIQVKSAKNWDRAIYDDELREQVNELREKQKHRSPSGSQSNNCQN
ncbi:MAG: pentapeptide repeat-containing protein [Xenococcaceae cyanobacterium MO_188.B32]|nr:pentapeptide repeat-containing protein [Xenococcaceae cyanobacterium MO_188.B32]